MTYQEYIQNYEPKDKQEQIDKAIYLKEFFNGNFLLLRESKNHLTASAIVLNLTRDKVLFAFHNIYQSFAWLGGHADGETDLEKVARKEVEEESGLSEIKLLSNGPSSIEILPVQGHKKGKKIVPPHYHYNVTFLYEADESLPIRINKKENSKVEWISIDDLEEKVSEKNMLPIYRKSIQQGKVQLAWSKPLLEWYEKNQRSLPWRQTNNPYKIWISEVMLQQTRVEAVKRYYERFLQAFPTVHALAEASEDKLMKVWEGLGYYSRAQNLKKAAEILVREYDGSFPNSEEELKKLPGIGVYTAGAILSRVHYLPVASLDGNGLRVLSRLLMSSLYVNKPQTKLILKKQIEEILPHDVASYNQALMELGALICVPNKEPKCSSCPLSSFCLAHAHHEETQYPKKGDRLNRKIEEKTFVFLLVRGRLLIEKRPEDGLLATLYQPLEFDRYIDEIELEKILKEKGVKKAATIELTHQKHIFTHKVWEMEGFLVRADAYIPSENQKFVTFAQLEEEYALPSAFKNFLKQIEQMNFNPKKEEL